MTIRKRVLVLTSTFPRWQGDCEPPFVFELTKRLGEHFEVFVLAPHAPGAVLIEEMGGIRVYRFRYFFTPWQRLAYNGGVMANLKLHKWLYLLVPFFVLSEFFSLISLVKKHKIDVIHAHWLIPQGLAAAAARVFLKGNRPAILCTSHGGDLFGLQGTLLSWVKRQVVRCVDRLTVVSGAMRDYAVALAGREDIEVVPMGVDLVRTFIPDQNTSRNELEILFAGRLVEKKGVAYLVQAMPEVLKCYPDARLLIAGDGPDRTYLEKMAQAIGVERHIQFLGNVENTSLPELYRRAAVFVAPSVVAQGGDQEGLGLVFVEALGCECPVVATDLPAIQDVVIDGVTGVICKRADSRDLAHKIVLLLGNPDLRRSLGRAGRAHVLERFDWGMVARRYAGLADDLASGK